jgi:hypothetical protein
MEWAGLVLWDIQDSVEIIQRLGNLLYSDIE